MTPFVIAPASMPESREFVEEHHYLHSLPTAAKENFAAVAGGEILAIASYGPVHSPKSPKGWLELRRLVRHPTAEIHLSKFLSGTLKALKTAGIPAALSWADPAAGHHGGIYQATNWIFTAPDSFNWNSSFVTETGDIVGHRAAFKMFGTSSKHKVLALRPAWRAFRPEPKYRYLMPLSMSRQECLSALGCEALPYPKPLFGILPRTKDLPR